MWEKFGVVLGVCHRCYAAMDSVEFLNFFPTLLLSNRLGLAVST